MNATHRGRAVWLDKIMRPIVTVYNSPVLPSEPSSRRPVRSLAGRTFVTDRTRRLATPDSPVLADRALAPHGTRVGTLRSPRRRPARVVSFSSWLSDRSQGEHYWALQDLAIRNICLQTDMPSVLSTRVRKRRPEFCALSATPPDPSRKGGASYSGTSSKGGVVSRDGGEGSASRAGDRPAQPGQESRIHRIRCRHARCQR